MRVNFKEYQDEQSTSETKSFFKSFTVLLFFGNFENVRDYFLSPHSNNLTSLAVFTFLLVSMGAAHYIPYGKHIKREDKIPLMIGGWGTRG